MKGIGVRIILVVEDKCLERFCRRALESLGFARHEIRVRELSNGKGSAKQRVDQCYAKEVKIHRATAKFQKVALLIGTDADELTLETRSQTLQQALAVEGLPPRDSREAIIHWIPKWSIETWALYLMGASVDENTEYRSTPQARDIAWRKSGRAFVDAFKRWEAGTYVPRLPSLEAGMKDTYRLPSS